MSKYMQTIDTYNFTGKRAIIRVDFNVPLNEQFQITDDTRIRAAIPTIKKVLAGGGSAIIMSHLGRPKGVTDKYSLRHILKAVESRLGVPVKFASDCMGEEARELSKTLNPGEALLLENLRFYAEEEGKPRGLADDAGDDEKKAAKAALKAKQKDFTKQLASYADCYINDAFGTAHRAHASTALIAEYFPNDKMFGYVMESEIKAVDKVLEAPERPFTAILGGSKVSSKITIIERLLTKVNNLVIGGGMSFTFIKAQGGKIGKSICEDDQLQLALDILKKAATLGVNIYLPTEVVIADDFSETANTRIAAINAIPDEWEGVDAAPASIDRWRNVLLESKTILWNGPVGVFEIAKFANGTKAIAQIVAEATAQGAYSLVGGGDSVAAVNQMGFADKVSYVSTGGGALLEYMEGVELPGVKAIRQ
jgi:phosphoglycerate kinase